MAYGLTIWFSGSSRMAGDSGGKREVNPEERGSKKRRREGAKNGGEREENLGGVRANKWRREGGKSGRKKGEERKHERDYSRTFRTSRKSNSSTT